MPEINKPPKKQIPFFEILKQAAQIVWQNRFLLWFGLLMALGSPGGSLNFNPSNKLENQEDALRSFLEAHWSIVIIALIILGIIGIILFFLSLIAKAGLIKSVSLLSQNKKTNFRIGWQFGKKYLSKLVGLFLLFFTATFVIVVVLGVPVIYLAISKAYLSAVLVGIFAVAILIPLVFIFTITKNFAEFYIILSGLRVRSAIETGYELLLKNIGHSIIFALLLLAVSIFAGLVLLPIVGITLFILVPTGIIFYYLSKIAFVIFLSLAILLFLAVILFASSILQTYKTTAWTLFFQEIAKIEKLETEKATQEALEKSTAATPASPS
jgi:hypothetical protein